MVINARASKPFVYCFYSLNTVPAFGQDFWRRSIDFSHWGMPGPLGGLSKPPGRPGGKKTNKKKSSNPMQEQKKYAANCEFSLRR